MIVIPAIDLRDGRCVRLVEGRADSTKVYDSDPVARARAFAAAGAERIHVVDLDGAFEGRPKNADVIDAIARAVKVGIEVGGGLRDEATVNAVLGAGARFAILGTLAVEQPEAARAICARFPGRVIVGIDARAGKVATAGWVATSDRDALDVAREAEGYGAAAIIYTDIARDGTGLGVNVAETARLAGAVSIPVIASGGVRSLDDVCALKPTRVAGVIIGRAIYEGDVILEDAIAAARGD